MTEVQNTKATPYSNRRAPVTHSEAVQEAKRREKMETFSSSHRMTGANQRSAKTDKDATP
ncbi:MAG: hypothetical protein ACRYGP_22110 [Janthinobacterium lividum]